MNNDRVMALMKHAAQMVNYNPATGSMVWRPRDVDVNGWNGRHAGKECGVIDGKGYRILSLRYFPGQQSMIKAHRLAWFIAFGVLPEGQIDHINQCKSDNRIENLRDVSTSLNMRNTARRADNTSGVTGVHWDKRREKWQAYVTVNSVTYRLGRFTDLAEAEKAVRRLRSKHGFTEIHGRDQWQSHIAPHDGEGPCPSRIGPRDVPETDFGIMGVGE